ncbi:MAG: hypothetical protein KY455_12230 [Euryarchaeota archaeon]|nr:hypothetical protein [Euryarchaeota archaeon]
MNVKIGTGERTGDATVYEVQVGSDPSATRHKVAVPDRDLARLAGTASADSLVAFAFEFLLEREPREAIMRAFDITVIEEYFPEFERMAKKRFG